MADEKDKVSIVVPIYKVERYLNRCVESILNQTYGILEVILVDDGSPDLCGQMAEEYAAKDPRVRVLHKENGGLSDARNYGMRYVTGKYTLFVDSDDWLEPNIVEEMVKASLHYQSDVVQAGFYYAYEDYLLLDNQGESKGGSPVILDRQTLMRELVKNEKVKNFAWGKLYKTQLVKDLPFQKGVLFEDVFWAHQVMHRVNTYVILHQPMYYYLQRNDSIVATYTPRNLDILKGLLERHQFVETYYNELVNESYKVIFKTSIMHYHLLLANRKKDKGGKHRERIQNYIKDHYPAIKKAVEEDPGLKNQLRLFAIHPYFNVLFLYGEKVLRKLRLIPRPVSSERISLNERRST